MWRIKTEPSDEWSAGEEEEMWRGPLQTQTTLLIFACISTPLTTTTKQQQRRRQNFRNVFSSSWFVEAAENINEAPPNLYLLLIQLQKVRNARNRTSFPVSNKGTSVRNFKSCASELVPQGPLPNHRLRPFVVMEQNGSCMRRGQERVVKRGPRPS